jgi:hypothetical protein
MFCCNDKKIEKEKEEKIFPTDWNIIHINPPHSKSFESDVSSTTSCVSKRSRIN